MLIPNPNPTKVFYGAVCVHFYSRPLLLNKLQQIWGGDYIY